jgi:hypothetical protein
MFTSIVVQPKIKQGYAKISGYGELTQTFFR